MRIITDSDGRVLDVSFGALISCGGQDGADYTGTVPTGYTSLEDWFIKEADKLYRWTVVDGELTLDSSATAPTDKLPAADYVVEQGTSGIWTYEKWASGKIKMKGRTTTTLSSSGWSTSGSAYYNSLSSRAFPFTLASVTYFNWYIQGESGYMMFTMSNPSSSSEGISTTGTGNLAVGRLTKPSYNLDVDLFFSVEGTWK